MSEAPQLRGSSYATDVTNGVCTPLSKNVTAPVFTGPVAKPVADTLAVNDTLCPGTDGFGVPVVSAVLVFAADTTWSPR